MTEKEFPNIARFARIPLLDAPTAIQRLARISQTLGPALRGVNLYVKRDDVTYIGGGGNKLRKLEFLIGEARAQGADTFITVGGLQSNHARLTAAASARTGMACELVLTRQVPRCDVDYECNGNMLLRSFDFCGESRGTASGRRPPRLCCRAGRFFADRMPRLRDLRARDCQSIPGNEDRLWRHHHSKR